MHNISSLCWNFCQCCHGSNVVLLFCSRNSSWELHMWVVNMSHYINISRNGEIVNGTVNQPCQFIR